MMQALRDLSIRRKLMLMTMAISVVVLLLPSAFFIGNEIVTGRRNLAEDTNALAQTLGTNCAAALTFNDASAAAETLQGLRSRPAIDYACIYDKNGNIFARYARSDAAEMLIPPHPRPIGTRLRAGHILTFQPILSDREQGQVGTIAIQADTRAIDARLRRYVLLAAVVLVLTFLVAFLLTSRLQRVISQPILDLAQTAKVVSEREDYSIRAAKRTQDETGVLTDRFNEMLARIQERDAELHAVNAQLAQSERMAMAANQAKSAFLATMSHELRTPLNAIIGFSEVLVDQTFGELNPKQVRYVNNILTSGRHLLQLINDILDLAKVEAGRMQLDESPFDVPSAMQGVEAVIKPLAAKKQIIVQTEVAPDVPRIVADEAKFKQILYNLFSNAIKYTPDGGTVTAKADTVEATDKAVSELFAGETPPAGRFLRVAVIDSGIGIKPEDLERVFGEFEQLDDSYARQQQGTGLGLSLTRKLVELHGGRIQAQSAGEGHGSAFTFLLPMQPAEAQKAAAEHAAAPVAVVESAGEAPGGERRTVLVIEDDRQASELLAHYLASAGYSVAQAYDGEQAIEMARRLRPHAITLDIILQKKTGWEVLSALKSLPETHDIPVVVVSMTEDQQLGMALGAAEYLHKPVDRERLIAAVAKARAACNGTLKTILVVDDDAQVLEMLHNVLEARGYTVLLAHGGREGLQMAQEKLPDAVILDLLMPEVTGFDVVQQMRGNEQTHNIPIIVFTAKDITEEDRQRLHDQVRAIVTKTGPDGLLRELEHCHRLQAGLVESGAGKEEHG
ncbi:MAG TPA: response regulator [Chthonomonadaceae bacterium]|nr:response regulator [Chthonomonadaceae bacterium]